MKKLGQKARVAIAIKWVIYFLTLFLLYIFEITPGFMQIFGIKPILIIPFVLAVVVFEGEFYGAIFGAISGLFLDVAMGRLFGFFAFFLLIICCLVGLLIIYLVKQNLVNTVIITALVLVALLLLDFYFNFAMWGYENSHIILIRSILPTFFYTIIFSPLFYLFVEKIYQGTKKHLE